MDVYVSVNDRAGDLYQLRLCIYSPLIAICVSSPYTIIHLVVSVDSDISVTQRLFMVKEVILSKLNNELPASNVIFLV